MTWEKLKSKLNIRNVIIGLLVALSALILINNIFFRNTTLNLEDENVVKNAIVKESDNYYKIGTNEIIKYSNGKVTYRTNGYTPTDKELVNIANELGVQLNDINVYKDDFSVNEFERRDPNLQVREIIKQPLDNIGN